MANESWDFWRLTRASDGALCWLGASRPGARAAIDRQKVWTLIPRRLLFIANWYVTEDRARPTGESNWVHELIDVDEARAVALEVPEPGQDDISRLIRPEACLTVDQIDRHPVERVLGMRVAKALSSRRYT